MSDLIEVIENLCFVNKNYLERKEIKEKMSFICSCTDKEMRICKPCRDTCHRNHQIKDDDDDSPIMFVCECAVNNHLKDKRTENKVQTINYGDLFFKDSSANQFKPLLRCNLIKIGKNSLHLNYYFKNSENNLNYCIFHSIDLPNLVKTKLKNDDEVFCSSNTDCEKIFEVFMRCMSSDQPYNIHRIFYNFINCDEFKTLFKPIEMQNKKYLNDEKLLQLPDIDIYYQHSSNLIKTFNGKVCREAFLLEDKDIYFIKDSQHILRKFINEKIDNTNMIIVLHNVLQTYRKFKMLAILIKKSIFRYSGFHNNVNVYLRNFFTLENLDQDTKELSKFLMDLFPIMINYVCNENYTILSDSENITCQNGQVEYISYNTLIIYEYIKLSKVFLYFKNDEETYKSNVRNLLSLASKNLKDKITFSRIIKIIFYNLLKIKDIAFDNFMNHGKPFDNTFIHEVTNEIKCHFTNFSTNLYQKIIDIDYILQNIIYLDTIYNDKLMIFASQTHFLSLKNNLNKVNDLSQNTKFLLEFASIPKTVKAIYQIFKNFFSEHNKFSNFNDELSNSLFDLKTQIDNLLKTNEENKTIQYFLCREGLLTVMFDVINYINSYPYLRKKYNKLQNNLTVFELIKDILFLLSKKNNLIVPLFFNTTVYRTIFFFGGNINNEMEKSSVSNALDSKYFEIFLKFYLSLLKQLRLEENKIDLYGFVRYIKNCDYHKNFQDDSIMQLYLETYSLVIKFNVPRTKSAVFKEMLSDITSSFIENKYKLFLEGIKGFLKEKEKKQKDGDLEDFKKKALEDLKIYIDIFKEVYDIVNSVSDLEGYFVKYNDFSILKFLSSFEVKISESKIYFLYFSNAYFKLIPKNDMNLEETSQKKKENENTLQQSNIIETKKTKNIVIEDGKEDENEDQNDKLEEDGNKKEGDEQDEEDNQYKGKDEKGEEEEEEGEEEEEEEEKDDVEAKEGSEEENNEDEENDEEDGIKEENKITLSKEEISILNFLIDFLTKYKHNYNKNLIDFKKNPLLNIPFFINSIFKPSIRIIYKFLFLNDLNEKGKLFFRLLSLFYKCYRLFLEKTKETFDEKNVNKGIKIKQISYLNKYFQNISNIEEFYIEYKNTMDLINKEIQKLSKFNQKIDFIEILNNLKKSIDIINYNSNQDKSHYVTVKTSSDLADIFNYINKTFTELLVDPYFDPNTYICEIIKDLKGAEIFELFMSKTDNFPDNITDISTFQLKLNLAFINLINQKFKNKEHPEILQEKMIINSNKIKFFKHSEMILTNLPDLIMLEYNSLKKNQNNIFHNYYMSLLEMLRLLCENHNQIYQTIYILGSNDDIELNKNFFNYVAKFWILINSSISEIHQREKVINIFKEESFKINDINERISEFLIETIQGTFESNFKSLKDNKSPNVLAKSFINLGRYIADSEIIENSIMNFLNFLLNFNQEKNAKEYFDEIFDCITPKIIKKFLMFFYKKLSMKYPNKIEVKDFDSYYPNEVDKDKSVKLLTFYGKNELIYNDMYFKAISYLYTLIINKTSLFDDEENEFHALKKELKEASNFNNNKQVNSKQKELLADMQHFLSSTHRTIEIKVSLIQMNKDLLEKHKLMIGDLMGNTAFKKYEEQIKKENSEEEASGALIVVVLHPISRFKTSDDISKIVDYPSFEKFFDRWNFILNTKKDLEYTFNLKCYILNQSEMMNRLINIQNENTLMITALLSVLTNVFYLIPSKHILLFNLGPITFLVHVYFLFYSIMISVYNDVLDLKIRKEKYEGNIFKDTLYFFIKEERLSITVNFILCLLSIYFNQIKNMFFSMQLFSVFYIFPVMTTVISAIKQKYKEFLYGTLLIIILTLFFSSISFYFFRNDYFNEDLNENVCDSYLACFLHVFNYGIRTGGIGDFSGLKPFNDPQFFTHFIFSWFFYFTLILIMLNVFNGIIVDTFQSLREEKYKKDKFQKNKCFICEQSKSDFEKCGKSFINHIQEIHNIGDYIHYLIALGKKGDFDLNSLESEVKKCIDNNRCDFFPLKNSIDLQKK